MTSGVKVIELDYAPRRLFLPYHNRTQRFAAMVAHRRCGKTVACVNDIIPRAASLKLQPGWGPGRYAYVGPYLGQAKEVAWEYLKQFAKPLIVDKNEGELWVELAPNKARIRIHGADNPDRLRGAYLDGVILDEYADMRPSVYTSIIRPMLADRIGWATFIGTPKGRNEFHKVFTRALTDDRFFTGAYRASETGLIPQSELDDARRDMTPEEYEQEFECSFDAAILGAYYSKEIARLEREGRICKIARADAPLYTAWDLGISANGMMAIWVFQVVAGQIRVLDFYANSGFGLEHYVCWLNDRGYSPPECTDWLPHDASVHELGTGKSRVETLAAMGRKIARIPRLGLADGINATKLELARMWFNEATTAEGVEALRQYRTEYDEKTKTFGDMPRRDWTTDIADAARYMAVAAREIAPPPPPSKDRPPGIQLPDLTMDQFMDLEDRPAHRERI